MSLSDSVAPSPATLASSGKPWRQRKRPAWVGIVAVPFLWLVFLPLTKLFARRWPRGLSRGLTRFLGKFPEDCRPAEHDVLICSYFKSGTNWTMQIAVQVAYRGRAEFEHIHELVPWPEIPDRAGFAVPLQRRPPA